MCHSEEQSDEESFTLTPYREFPKNQKTAVFQPLFSISILYSLFSLISYL